MLPIEIRQADPLSPAARELLELLSDRLEEITGDSGRSSFDVADVQGEGSAFAMAFDENGMALGCGAFRPLVPGVCEIKRMYARAGSKGVGAALLNWLECRAAQLGYSEAWLETRRVNPRAVNFYLKQGYREIPNFGKYAGKPEAICLAKQMGS